MLEVSLLGTGGMMPLPNRFLTSLIVRYKGKSLLIDCGEGTQVTLRKLGWSFKSIDYICFTHYHGDHIGGLPGLLLSIGNSERKDPLTLIGPKGLKRVVTGLLLIAPELPFDINYIELSNEEIVDFCLGEYYLKSFKLDHGTPCVGYSIDIKRSPKFLPNKAKELKIPIKYWSILQKGEEITHDGITYTPDMVLGNKRKGLKISYCTDTRPKKLIEHVVKESDLFICEGMYGDLDKQDKAKQYKHMTFYEAANIAKNAEVKELWLTHFSPSLVNPYDFEDNVKKIFVNTIIGKDRLTKTLYFTE